MQPQCRRGQFHKNRYRPIGLLAILATISGQGCRTPNSMQASEAYGVVTEDAQENLYNFGEFKTVRTYRNNSECGHKSGGLQILRGEGPISVYNSKAYYKAGMQGGQPDFTFALQFYTKESARQGGGTPIIRVVKKEDYVSRYFEHERASNDNCDFSSPNGEPNRTALMFVYGVESAGRGESLPMLDYNMLKALINFEMTANTPPPAGDGKIGRLPAYIQMVANTGKAKDGIFGKHDQDAATRVAFNLSGAYEGGVETMDIVTHSNGMISSQIGYAYYAHHFMRDEDSRNKACLVRAASQGLSLIAGEPCHDQIKPLKLNFFHFQAAPDEIWTIQKRPPYPPGFYTDFVPVFKQESKGSIQAISKYPEDDQATYFFNLRKHFSWAFRYYYNNGDFLTYPPQAGVGTLILNPLLYAAARNGYSSVGINESIAWVKFAMKLEKLMGKDKFLIGHYYCDQDSFSKKSCGQKHSPYHSIMDVSHPSRIKLANWKAWYTK